MKPIKLTEAQLHRIIKESVKRIVAENDYMVEDRYSVYENGEFIDSANDLERAIEIANHFFGNSYSDDIIIWDNLKDEEVE